MDAFQIVKKTVEEHGMADRGEHVIVGFSGGPDSMCLLHCLYQLFGAERLAAVHVNHLLRGEAAERDARQAAEFCRRLQIPFFLCRAEVRELADRMKLTEEEAGRRTRFFVFRQVRELLQNKRNDPEGLKMLWNRQIAINDSIDINTKSDDRPFLVLQWDDRHDGSFVCEAGTADLEQWLGAGRDREERIWRYGAQAQNYHYSVLIAVAQNADDQAETVLMRVLRGTGIAGLGAMEYVRADGVIRPLLDVPRRGVEAYCHMHGLCPSVDETNAETHYTRNRIRRELLPYLRERFNPNVDQALHRLASIARQDASFIDDEAKQRLFDVMAEPELRLDTRSKSETKQAELEMSQPVDRLCLDLSGLRRQHPAVRTRMLMLALEMTGLYQDITSTHLRGAEKLIDTGKEGAVAEFPQNFRMKIRRGQVEIYREKNADPAAELGQYRLSFRTMSAEEARSARVEPGCSFPGIVLFLHCFDSEAVAQSGLPLVLRTRKPGDFIRPLGMNGTKKIQDFLVDRKVPRELRDRTLMVCLGQEVIWAAGIVRDGAACIELSYIGEPYKVRPDSQKILEISIVYCSE